MDTVAFYGTNPQRRAHPSLERNRRLSARRHFEKASASGCQPLHYSTDFEPHALRENAHFTGTCSIATHAPITRHLKSSMFTGVLNGTLLTFLIKFYLLGAPITPVLISNPFPVISANDVPHPIMCSNEKPCFSDFTLVAIIPSLPDLSTAS